ncbi:MAG: hypothetical protein J1E81_04690 [Eubacterium sp.]|nr:hypothetical protein [Eubacterium sp.]
MKFTSSAANKELRKLNEKLSKLQSLEEQYSVFTVEKSEDVEAVRPAFNFEENYRELTEVIEKIRTTKHAIKLFNATTVVGSTKLTIDEILLMLPILQERKRMLSNLSLKMPKERHISRINRASNFIEYDIINFDSSFVKNECEKIENLINDYQLQLDVTNNTVEFDIDY